MLTAVMPVPDERLAPMLDDLVPVSDRLARIMDIFIKLDISVRHTTVSSIVS